MKKISVIKIQRKNISKAVDEMMQELKYKPNKQKILLKPNLAGSFIPDSPFVTKTVLVETLIKYFLSHGIKNHNIVVAEGTGNNNTPLSLKIAGYYKLQKKYGFKIIDLNNEKADKINGIYIPKIIHDYEYINIGKLKTHIQTTVTLCVKNQKGLPPVMQKRKFHQYNYLKADLHHNIAELYKTIKPDLSIIDATSGIEGNGPAMGHEVKDVDLLIGGYNAIDVDHVGTMIMGIDPLDVKHLVLSSIISNHKVKLNSDINKKIKRYRKKFLLPSSVHSNYKINWLFGDQTCSGCIIAMFKMKKFAMENIRKNPFRSLKIAYLAFIGGIDIMTGDAKIKNPNSNMLACGDCCKKIAKKNHIKFVKGCPPDEKEIYKNL